MGTWTKHHWRCLSRGGSNEIRVLGRWISRLWTGRRVWKEADYFKKPRLKYKKDERSRKIALERDDFWKSITHTVCQALYWALLLLLSRSVVSDSARPQRRQPTRLPRPWDSPGKNTGVGCHFLLQRMEVKSESEVAQSCPTLSDPMDCSLPGPSVHGIFQARVLEWVAIAFSVVI